MWIALAGRDDRQARRLVRRRRTGCDGGVTGMGATFCPAAQGDLHLAGLQRALHPEGDVPLEVHHDPHRVVAHLAAADVQDVAPPVTGMVAGWAARSRPYRSTKSRLGLSRR